MPAGGPVASLGELAQRAGLIDAPASGQLVAELRARVQGGRATSFGALLLERGISTDRVLALAASGARFSAMLCDVCATPYPIGAFPPAREFLCTRCGAKVLAFGQAAVRPATRELAPPRPTGLMSQVHPMPGGGVALAVPSTPDGNANEDDTERFPIKGLKGPVPAGLPPPMPSVAGGRVRFGVPPEPSPPSSDEGGERTIGFSNVIAIPPAPFPPPPTGEDPELAGGERTIGFSNVIAIPPAPGFSKGPLPELAPQGTANFQGIMPIPMSAPPPSASAFAPPPGTPPMGTPLAGPLPAPEDPGFGMNPVSDFDPQGTTLDTPPALAASPEPASKPSRGTKTGRAERPEKAASAPAAEPEKQDKGTSRKPLATRKRDRGGTPSEKGESSGGSNNVIYAAIGLILAAVLAGTLFVLGVFDAKPAKVPDSAVNKEGGKGSEGEKSQDTGTGDPK